MKIKPVRLGATPWGFRFNGIYIKGPLTAGSRRYLNGEDDSAEFKTAITNRISAGKFITRRDALQAYENPVEIENKYRSAAIKKMMRKREEIKKRISLLGPIGVGIDVGGNLHEVPAWLQVAKYIVTTVTYTENYSEQYDMDGIPHTVETYALPFPTNSAYYSFDPEAVYLRNQYDDLYLKIGRMTVARLPLFTGKGKHLLKDVPLDRGYPFGTTNMKEMSLSMRSKFARKISKNFFLLFPQFKEKPSAASIPTRMMEYAINTNRNGGSVTLFRAQKQWHVTTDNNPEYYDFDFESEENWPPRSSSIAYLDRDERKWEAIWVESWLRGKKIGYKE